jgi:hypothetical protein
MSSYPKTKSEKTKSLLHAFALLCAIMVGFLLFFKMAGLMPRLPDHPISAFTTNGYSSGEFTSTGFLNLTTFYNAGLETNWMEAGKGRRKGLSLLPQGTNSFSGVAFRVQDVVQLRGSGVRKYASSYPDRVEGIPVNMKCAEIHFLHGTAWSAKEGTRIGAYIIHFADGSHLEVPIVYGADVRDWSFDAKDVHQTNGAAWSSKERRFVRIYRSTWANPKAMVEVKDIDFVSLGSSCYPFLLSITVE